MITKQLDHYQKQRSTILCCFKNQLIFRKYTKSTGLFLRENVKIHLTGHLSILKYKKKLVSFEQQIAQLIAVHSLMQSLKLHHKF